MLSISNDHRDRTVELPLGQVMELRLEENPTTGFRWNIASDGQPACQIIGDSFTPQGTVPGRGGEHAWRFQGVCAGSGEIELLYRRPWESAEPARSFRVCVRVTR